LEEKITRQILAWRSVYFADRLRARRGDTVRQMASLASSHLADAREVADVAASARQAGRLGIDTEFMSEGRYRALLCLVQVAVDDPDGSGDPRVILLDALTDLDVRPLAELVGDPAIEVVLHAGRQDVAILRRAWGTEVTNIFDTQVAAGFAGGSAQTGYGNLLGSVLGRSVGKTASYTRWDARPLTAEQLAYAAEDVVHLLELADELQRRLKDTGRLEWAREECRRLEGATDERDPEVAWERLPRIGGLDPRARAVARELAAWRERTAAAEDKPVGTILGDPPLVEVAKRQPRSARELEQIRGIHPSAIKRRGAAILEAVQRGRAAPPIPREPGRARSEPGDGPLIVLAEALLRARALDAGLAYELLSSRNELEAMITAVRRGDPEPDIRALSGWRQTLVGRDLHDLLAGQCTLGVGPDRRLALTRIPPPASG
jgi:ribonuclease D